MNSTEKTEIERLQLENKKLARELRRERLINERNRVIFEAKNRLGDVIAAEKSRMEQYMQLLLDNSRDFILLFDKDGCLVYCTKSYLDAIGSIGLPPGKGKTFHELFDTLLDKETMNEIIHYSTDAKLNEAPFGKEFDLQFPNSNELRSYRLMSRPMWDENGNVQGFFVIFYDTTDLVNAKKEADRANAAKSDFIAAISHDIRTPLNAIIGISQMLGNTVLDDKQTEFLTKIQRSSTIMLDLINDILDFSKISSSKMELVEEYFDFPKMLTSLYTVIELLMNQKQLAFHVSFPEDLPTVVYGDSKRILQVLSNLLNNAYKYTPSGWVTFEVRVEDDENAISDTQTKLFVFAIKDTGIGIKEEDRTRLFSEFVQLDLAKNKNISGTGLGLAITKKLLTLMNGDVSVESEYQKGSTFTVTIPLKTGTNADLPQEDDEMIGFSAPDARVLVVDDIEINLEIAQYMLQQFHIECDVAYNGEQAIEMIQQNDYDIVLMDHMMPVMDGIEATQYIRTLPTAKREIPIVALTANAVSGMTEIFTRAGFNGFISKPIDEKILARTLLQMLPAERIQR
ncbi:MAG: response regulator [Clostridiales Family XIII bacterium]|nr:response regulator [Clostridiales Family XIII bacterium]